MRCPVTVGIFCDSLDFQLTIKVNRVAFQYQLTLCETEIQTFHLLTVTQFFGLVRTKTETVLVTRHAKSCFLFKIILV